VTAPTSHPATPSLVGPLVGVSAVITRGDRILLGRRRGAHGAGAYAFPGGKPHPGESPDDAVAREVLEETGLTCTAIRRVTWTNEVFAEAGLHFVTLHHQAEVADGEPQLLEPEKCEGWDWYRWDDLPQPLFTAAANLIDTGWRPPT
jgi:8-oxo-dGTP diphosphatase